MTLSELYNRKLLKYKMTGQKEQLDKLLAMLLLPEKDNFEPLKLSEGEFYNKYKTEIDEKINKVIQEFEITDEEIIQLIEEKGIININFESDKIWFVFADGFGVMHWGIMYHPEKTPEEIYAAKYGWDDFINENFDDVNIENIETMLEEERLVGGKKQSFRMLINDQDSIGDIEVTRSSREKCAKILLK